MSDGTEMGEEGENAEFGLQERWSWVSSLKQWNWMSYL